MYDSTGKDYINEQKSTSSEDDNQELFIYALRCNGKETDFDGSITNGEPYDVQWFKTGETGRVEDNHKNMWTNYKKEIISSYKVTVAGSADRSIRSINLYDLIIFNVQTSIDEGTYSCEAVSRVNNKKVLLGSTVLTVPKGMFFDSSVNGQKRLIVMRECVFTYSFKNY